MSQVYEFKIESFTRSIALLYRQTSYTRNEMTTTSHVFDNKATHSIRNSFLPFSFRIRQAKK